MHSYLIDELSEADIDKIARNMKDKGLSSIVEGVFWLLIPEKLLSVLQKEHLPTCGPFKVAIILEEDSVQVELLIRSESTMHCSCISYATPEVREYIICFFDSLLLSLDIK